jgi:hypothetical protein
MLAVLTEAQAVVEEEAARYVPRCSPRPTCPTSRRASSAPEAWSASRRTAGRSTRWPTARSPRPRRRSPTAHRPARRSTGRQLARPDDQAPGRRHGPAGVGVLTASRPNLGGYVRVLNPPSCQRCAILAGRFYRWSSGFRRHPRCDCVNLPSEQAGWAKSEGFLTDPMDAYRERSDPRPDQAQVNAIENGADIGQVVNATRGMSTTALTTREANSRRGIAGKTCSGWELRPRARPAVLHEPDAAPHARGDLPVGRRPGRSDRAPAARTATSTDLPPFWAASTCTGDLQSRTGADMTSDTSTTADDRPERR